MLKPILICSLAFAVSPLLTSTATAQSDKAKSAKPKTSSAKKTDVATLGITTNQPSKKVADARGLKHEVRYRGQVVTSIQKKGPAGKAGLKLGDIIEKIDDNEIYSQDDIADFLRTSKPLRKVKLQIVRAKGGKKAKKLNVILGASTVKVAKKAKMTWQFASLAQLDEAMARAKKEQRLILVGLSGAET